MVSQELSMFNDLISSEDISRLRKNSSTRIWRIWGLEVSVGRWTRMSVRVASLSDMVLNKDVLTLLACVVGVDLWVGSGLFLVIRWFCL